MNLKKMGEKLRRTYEDVADVVTGKAAEREKMRRVRRCVCTSVCGAALFAAGCWLGIHRTVIRAALTGEKEPSAPGWHFWCR